tara:strand:- start:1401 stop:2054 length:654 start_codon:yes stop_codon:yes gene_type:complete
MNLGIVAGLQREMGFFKNRKNLLITSGYSRKSINATKELIKKKMDLIISFGFAASLCKSVKTGDIIIPKKIVNATGNIYDVNSEYLDLFKKRIKKKIFCQNLFTSSEIVSNLNNQTQRTIKKKNSFSFVDMEAIHVCKVAQENKIPFIAIKIIFDDLHFSIPQFMTSCIDQNGEVKIYKLLLTLIANPRKIKDTLELKSKYKIAEASAIKVAESIAS